MKYKDLYRAAKKDNFLDWLFDRKKYKIYELHALDTYNQNPLHHPEGYTVLDHVKAAVRDYQGSDPIVKLALLFHDIGKMDTAEPSSNGNYFHFYGHDKEGEKRFRRIAKKYEFPDDVTEAIAFAVRHHMRFYKICDMTDKKVKALVNSPYWDLLVTVAYHDDHCRGQHFSNKDFERCMEHAMKIKQEVHNG